MEDYDLKGNRSNDDCWSENRANAHMIPPACFIWSFGYFITIHTKAVCLLFYLFVASYFCSAAMLVCRKLLARDLFNTFTVCMPALLMTSLIQTLDTK